MNKDTTCLLDSNKYYNEPNKVVELKQFYTEVIPVGINGGAIIEKGDPNGINKAQYTIRRRFGLGE